MMPTPMEDPDAQSGAEWDSVSPARPDHAVEGDPPSRKVRRMELRVLIPVMVVALAAGAIFMYYYGGWAAAALGGVILAVYYLIGCAPAIGAAILRRKSHED